MVQSENQGAGGAGGGKKKNRRNRNKNKKNQQQQSDEAKVEIEVAPPPTPEQPAAPPTKPMESRSASESSSEVVQPSAVVAPPADLTPKADAKKEAEVKPLVDLLRNLAQDFMPYNLSELNDAERSYYESKTTEDDVDLFASDEEPQEKPKMVKPQQSKVPPKQQAPAKKKQTKAPKAKGDNDTASQPLSTTAVQNPKNGERTFIMLKPDAVQRKLVGEIIGRFEGRGFKLVALKFMHASRNLLERHYADLSKKPFFPELIRYMSSGPVVPMVWEGLNVVKTGRVMLGETNPQNSAPGTIRGDYCIDVGRNIIHGSDSLESAAKEIAMWFGNVSDWRPAAVAWIYEDEEDEKAAPVAVQAVDGLAAMAGGVSPDVANKLASLEADNKEMKKVISDLRNLVITLQGRVDSLEKGGSSSKPAPAAPAPAADDDDDDVDLFGSEDEEEDAEKERVKAERLKAYQEKKAKKPKVIAKTSVLIDVKPWDDETDMDAMLKAVKSIEKDGLVWGASKLVPVGYGINKLQVLCVVEDEKVSIEELCEQIAEFEDYVQNADVASMQKI